MLDGSPDRSAMEEAARGFGLQIEWEGPPDETEVYPDHWVPMQVIQAMGTQWNLGPTGRAVGLRYEALPAVLQMLLVPRPDRAEVFATVQVLEAELLKIVRSRAN